MNINDFKSERYLVNDECLACGSNNLERILDFGKQPLANNYHDTTHELEEYPLNLNMCKDCYHLQLGEIVDPDLMFRDYLYVSGTTKTLREYFEWFANWSTEKLNMTNYHGVSVLDIACNDGTQLDEYKKLGCKTYGIDPAINLFETSSSKGHEIVLDYFPSEALKDKKFDIIVAQNVFAHNLNPSDFLKACKEIMNDDGLLFIQTSQANMVQNGEFDTIYHEHISFFNPMSMMKLVEMNRLQIHDIHYTEVHGTSYVFVIRNPSGDPVNQGFIDVFQKTSKEGLFERETYIKYAERASQILKDFSDTINKLRKEGYLIIGYGAAAKGNTLLNASNVSLDFIVDDNPLKQGMYTPGMNIPIFSPNQISDITTDKIAFVPLAWNFYKEIRERILSKRNNPNDVFVSYFPDVSVMTIDNRTLEI